MSRPTVVLGLGSSEGDTLAWLRRAVARIKREPSLRVLGVSPVYQSDAMMPENAPSAWNVPYLNLAVACELRRDLAPLELLERIKLMEKELGRRDRERWAPREIDIDLLAWEGVELAHPRLKLPHAGLVERPFALLPLADAWPAFLDSSPQAREAVAGWRSSPKEEVPFRTHRILRRLTELVAILNVTPDSFSDGGRLPDPGLEAEAFLASATEAVRAGATVLDLGAESTRPGAVPVDPAEEWRRLEPALRGLQGLRARGVRLSLDSRRPETVERAIGLEAIDWINDVEGFADRRMRELARASAAELVFMHSLGVPPSRALTLPAERDPAEQLLDWARVRADELASCGIPRERLIFDPGIGFGKSAEQAFRLLRDPRKLHESGLRVLIGHSRKSFLAPLEEGEPRRAAADRDLETAILSARLADQGIEYLRVHDVPSQARALRLSAALDGGSRWSG